MEYVTSAPQFKNGWLLFYIAPEQQVQAEREVGKYKESDQLTLIFKKRYKKRTIDQLGLVWVIAEKMAHDENSSCYGQTKEEIYEGIRFRAVDFGFPTTEIRFGNTTKRVPKSTSNAGDLDTKQMSILVETGLLLGSEAGVDLRAEKNEWQKLIGENNG